MNRNQNPNRDRAAVAAVDLGSESALLLIARRDETGGVEVLEDHATSARLAGAVTADGELREAELERTLEVLETYARRVELAGVAPSRCRAVGTAAVRALRDPDALVRLIAERSGLELEVLSPEAEGRISFAGAVPREDFSNAILIDVGGGSTEVTWDAGRAVVSVPLGAVVATALAEQGNARDEQDASGLDVVRERFQAAIGAFDPPALGGCRVVLVGGTASNLACLVRDAETYDHRLAEGATVTRAAARDQATRLSALDSEDRLDLGIEPQRAAILPAGLVCLEQALAWLGAEEAQVTGRGLRFGLVNELLDGPSAAIARQE
ncbi:MAG: Ppx/GppA phosphatase family protein [Planctomycetota bacterium]